MRRLYRSKKTLGSLFEEPAVWDIVYDHLTRWPFKKQEFSLFPVPRWPSRLKLWLRQRLYRWRHRND